MADIFWRHSSGPPYSKIVFKYGPGALRVLMNTYEGYKDVLTGESVNRQNQGSNNAFWTDASNTEFIISEVFK